MSKYNKNTLKKKTNLKNKSLFKKFKWTKIFNKTFIFSKKITFFKKLKTYYNESLLLWHSILKNYSFASKINIKKFSKKIGHIKFFLILQKFETRLSTLLLRARFFYNIISAVNAIKLYLILVNGIIISNINFLVKSLDLFQKRRYITLMKKKVKKNLSFKRIVRLKWRKYRWKQARFFFDKYDV